MYYEYPFRLQFRQTNLNVIPGEVPKSRYKEGDSCIRRNRAYFASSP